MSADSAVIRPDTAAHASLKFLLIGGTGFVGQQLAPVLAARGHGVTIMSRVADPAKDVLGQHNLPDAIVAYDIIMLLSVLNNNVAGDAAAYRSINVDLPLAVLAMMPATGRRLLLLCGSDLAATSADDAPYNASKAELADQLRQMNDARVRLLVLSPVHGRRFVKRLAIADRLPAPLRAIAVATVGALRPLSHVNGIARAAEALFAANGGPYTVQRVVDDQDGNRIYRTTIRFFDLAFAAVVLVAFGWLMLILALLVAVTSPGPALFRQSRIGRNGRVFTCYKFRTMRQGTAQVATHHVAADATTAIGRRLRRWKLDELPQIFNIFANDMSLVGPRPGLPVQIELVAARDRLGVLRMKPGITGWSQIAGIDMSDPERLALADADYGTRRSIPLYVKIVVATFLGRGQGDRVRHG